MTAPAVRDVVAYGGAAKRLYISVFDVANEPVLLEGTFAAEIRERAGEDLAATWLVTKLGGNQLQLDLTGEQTATIADLWASGMWELAGDVYGPIIGGRFTVRPSFTSITATDLPGVSEDISVRLRERITVVATAAVGRSTIFPLAAIMPRGATGFPTQNGGAVLEEFFAEKVDQGTRGRVVDDLGGFYLLDRKIEVPWFWSIVGAGARGATVIRCTAEEAGIWFGAFGVEGARQQGRSSDFDIDANDIATSPLMFGWGANKKFDHIRSYDSPGRAIRVNGLQNSTLTAVEAANSHICWEYDRSAGNLLMNGCGGNNGDLWVVNITDSGTSYSANLTTNIFTVAGHGFLYGEALQFNKNINPDTYAARTLFYALPIDANTFQVSATVGGAAVDLTGATRGKVWLADVPDDYYGPVHNENTKLAFVGGIYESNVGDATFHVEAVRGLDLYALPVTPSPTAEAAMLIEAQSGSSLCTDIHLAVQHIGSALVPAIKSTGSTRGTRIVIDDGAYVRTSTLGAILLDDNSRLEYDTSVQFAGSVGTIPLVATGTKQIGRLARLNGRQRVYLLTTTPLPDASPTYTDLLDLTADADPYTEYEADVMVLVNGSTLGDIVYRFTRPTGSTIHGGQAIGPAANLSAAQGSIPATAFTHNDAVSMGGLDGSTVIHRLRFKLRTGADAGVLTVRATELTNTATPSLLVDSEMTLTKVGTLAAVEDPEPPEEEMDE